MSCNTRTIKRLLCNIVNSFSAVSALTKQVKFYK